MPVGGMSSISLPDAFFAGYLELGEALPEDTVLTANPVPSLSASGPDPFADDGRTMADIRVCEAVHEARAAFREALVAGSAVQERHFVHRLRQEPVYRMAEFFYLLRAFRLDGEDKIRRYAELHNRHLEALGTDPARMRRLGLTRTRVEKGVFAPESIPKLVENYRGGGAIDQSDLSRLLIEAMSTETCRQTAVTLTRAGYLERRVSPWRSVLVRSTGTMERLFAESLAHVRRALAADAGTMEETAASGEPA